MADSYISARERVAGEYSFTLRRKDGTILTTLSTLTLTLAIKGTASYINSRNKQDILGAGAGQNNVTFAAGVVTWSMQPADNALAGEADETHIALFEWTGTNEDDFHEVEIFVPNTRTRP